MQDLADKVAVVTGGASGIGHAMASRFANQGMKLVFLEIEAPTLSETTRVFDANSVEALTQRLDVSNAAEMDRLADITLERFGEAERVDSGRGSAIASPPMSLQSKTFQCLGQGKK